MSPSRQRIVRLVAALPIAAGIGCGAEEEGGAFPTAVVERRPLEISAQAAGTIEPVSVVIVKSKAAGEIVDLAVESGDVAEAGDLLVQVERDEAENLLAQARADHDVAEAQLAVAATELMRVSGLFDGGIVSSREKEQAELEHAIAEAVLVRAQADLQNAEEWLAETRVTAPSAGTILSCSVTEGQVIASATRELGGGTELMRMADLREVQVRALVDETDIGKVSVGMTVEIRVDAYPGRQFAGLVLKVEPQAVYDQNVTHFPVIVRIGNEDGLLLPGMSVEAEFLVARHSDVLVLPNQAVNSHRDAQMIAELIFGFDKAAFEGELVKLSGDSARVTVSDISSRTGAGGGHHGARGRGPHGSGPPHDTGRQSSVVFRIGGGVATPIEVVSGLTDYDRTEILDGLEEGDSVAVFPTASLLRDQQALRDRVQRWSQGSFGVRRTAGN